MSEKREFTQELIDYANNTHDLTEDDLQEMPWDELELLLEQYEIEERQFEQANDHECTPAPVRLGGSSIYCKECNALMEQ